MAKSLTIETCTKGNIHTIIDGINDYNLSNVAAVIDDIWTPLEFVVKDDKGDIIGGVLSGIGYWGGLEIKVLWVEEEHRNQGIGKFILKYIENRARQLGATDCMLDTFDFQADYFYSKNGYKMIGKIDNFPKGHTRKYFAKKLL